MEASEGTLFRENLLKYSVDSPGKIQGHRWNEALRARMQIAADSRVHFPNPERR